ncbi:MAG TPA: hypothetical protein VMD74_00535 [Candidatus Methylomirabilis sp.]|nr:hypothetical protein [Candidatus Methylomirabilis sp.]
MREEFRNEAIEKGESRENVFEKEEEVREIITAAFHKKKEESVSLIANLVEKRVEKANPPLPEPLKAMIMADYEMAKAVTNDEKVLKAVVEVSFRRVICGYERRITDQDKVPNEAYARLNAIEKIDSLFGQEKEPAPEDFKKVAHVTFDLNGLKAVNDYNGHDTKKGDEYLFAAVQAIVSDSVKKYAKDNGIFFEPERVTRDGGDEFSIIITSENVLTKKVLEGFILAAQTDLWENSKVGEEILNFDNSNVLGHHLDMPAAEVEAEIKSSGLENFKKAHGIPPKYKYHGAMSGGAITLYDALTDKEADEKNKVNPEDQYPYMLQKMMGTMFSISSKRMDVDKKKFKKGLAAITPKKILEEFAERGFKLSPEQAEVEVANRHMLAEVYSRTDTEKELAQRNAKLEKELEVQKAQISLIIGVIEEAEEKKDWELIAKATKLLRELNEKK